MEWWDKSKITWFNKEEKHDMANYGQLCPVEVSIFIFANIMTFNFWNLSKLGLYIQWQTKIVISFWENKQIILVLAKLYILSVPWNTICNCFYPIKPKAREYVE